MRLLKIVAIPAAISLLLTPTDATEAKARSKILGKIQKNALAQATQKSNLAQTMGGNATTCTKCTDSPCHDKFKDTDGKCPDGDQYHVENYAEYEGLYP